MSSDARETVTGGPSLARMAASIPGVMFALARDAADSFEVLYVSDGARELFDVEPEELISDFGQVLASVHPDDVGALRESLSVSAQDLSRWDWSGRVFAADGSLKYLRGVADAPREQDGTTIWEGVLIDQTEVRWESALEGAMRRRLQTIVEHLPASSVALYDRNLRLCLLEGELFAHADSSQMLGRTLPSFVGPEMVALIQPGLEAALAGEPAAPVVIEDSQGRSLAINFAPYQVTNGRIDGAVAHCQDVSELRQAERARHAAEEVLNRGFDEAPIGMALVAQDGRLLRVNRALSRTVGYSVSELLEMTNAAITHPADVDNDIVLVSQLLAGEISSYQFEKRYVRKDGELVWARLSVSLARDDRGNPLHFVAQVEDVTESRRAEQELAQTRAEIDRFFGLSLDLMAIMDANGYFVRINPAFEATLGYTRGELMRRPCTYFVHPDDVAATEEVFARQVGGNSEVVGFENRYRCRDGSYRWLLWSATALEDGYVYATARDVTERREMEQRLRESHEQALSASRMKSEFVANMSHEIRTPLNGVLSMSELMLGTELSDEQREYADVTATSAQALMRVIDDILDFSKIEAGKLEILTDDFEIEAVVAEVCEIVGVKAREKRLVVRYDVARDVPAVLRGDSGRLRQVLMNLVGNAVKFTSDGEVSVDVGLVRGEDGAPRVHVEVRDTGIGIDPDLQRKLFQPFAQADATTTRRYGGTGLGLSIARQLVELMDGQIGLRSTPGQGSTFYFSLPCEPGSGADVQPAGRDLTGVRVLIVAPDSPGQPGRTTLERLAASWGMIPQGAGDAATALELLVRGVDTGRPFELALVDHGSGELDGRALAAQIERSPRLRSTRRVLLDVAPASEPLTSGLQSTLVKPVWPSQLYNHLVYAPGAAPAAVPARVRRPPALQPSGRRGRVLVAEDNEINQFAALRMLSKLGYEAEVAEDGREAVEMAARGRYTAIFMDCQMPELDGYKATVAIRHREGDGPRTPIIAMTANTMAGDRERCLGAGMDDYLAKPLRLERLAEVCSRWLRDPAPALAAAPEAPQAAPFDPTVLAEFASPAQSAELLALFVGQLEEGMSAVARHVSEGEFEDVARTAHRLKGSAATIGAGAVAEIMHAVCRDARVGGTALPELQARAQKAAQATIERIRAHLASAVSASDTAADTRR